MHKAPLPITSPPTSPLLLGHSHHSPGHHCKKYYQWAARPIRPSSGHFEPSFSPHSYRPSLLHHSADRTSSQKMWWLLIQSVPVQTPIRHGVILSWATHSGGCRPCPLLHGGTDWTAAAWMSRSAPNDHCWASTAAVDLAMAILGLTTPGHCSCLSSAPPITWLVEHEERASVVACCS